MGAEPSPLVVHARRELNIVCPEDQDTITGCVAVVQALSNMRMSNGQASWVLPVLHRLFQGQPLTLLTDDPEDWIAVDQNQLFDPHKPLWQNRRWSEAISDDGGKTYWLSSEISKGYEKRYKSEPQGSNLETLL